MINVTKTFLPPIEEYQAILNRAWDLKWITNRGVLVQELEEKLKAYLGVANMLITTNGTLPIQIAIKALDLRDEIITTPFSYIATTSSIVWEGCRPVFVDIHPEYLTIDETKIEQAITPNTTAILATHVFGNPCHIDAINTIAEKHDLKIIYDAAHCFGVTYKSKSIFSYGDISTCSFHATKLFHTGEGGALFTKDNALLEKLFYKHNFGHKGKEDFYGVGINAKISELQAALGLSVFPYIEEIINCRKKVVDCYNAEFLNCDIQLFKLREGTKWNYSYYPVVLKSEEQLLKIVEVLNSNQIIPRRYFYPSLNTLNFLKMQKCKVSESIASRVLCLPLYKELTTEEASKVANLIKIVL